MPKSPIALKQAMCALPSTCPLVVRWTKQSYTHERNCNQTKHIANSKPKSKPKANSRSNLFKPKLELGLELGLELKFRCSGTGSRQAQIFGLSGISVSYVRMTYSS